jgi:hypothetical protein
MFLTLGRALEFGQQNMVLLTLPLSLSNIAFSKPFPALEHPTTEVIGSDLSPIQPELYITSHHLFSSLTAVSLVFPQIALLKSKTLKMIGSTPKSLT